jgi:hypothetical protein
VTNQLPAPQPPAPQPPPQPPAPQPPAPQPDPLGQRILKILAEILKYCCFDVLIAIGLPLIISIPLRNQEAAVDKSLKTLGFAGQIGLPDLLISCAILAWAAMRNIMDADIDESVRQIGFTLTFVCGVMALILAWCAQNLTFANFSTANSFLYYSIPAVLVFSFITAGTITFVLGMQRG